MGLFMLVRFQFHRKSNILGDVATLRTNAGSSPETWGCRSCNSNILCLHQWWKVNTHLFKWWTVYNTILWYLYFYCQLLVDTTFQCRHFSFYSWLICFTCVNIRRYSKQVNYVLSPWTLMDPWRKTHKLPSNHIHSSFTSCNAELM